MKTFKGWTNEQMKSIKAPTLVINGNQDVDSIESAVEMYRIIPHGKLAIFPGGHGDYLEETTFLDNGNRTPPEATVLIEDFLDKN